MNSSTLDRNYRRLHQTIGRVHIPAEPIHTAGRVYRHFVNNTHTLSAKSRTIEVIFIFMPINNAGIVYKSISSNDKYLQVAMS